MKWKVKKLKFYKQLYINMALTIAFVFIPIIAVIYINGQNFSNEIKNYEYKTNLDTMYKTQTVVDNFLQSVNVSIQKLCSNETIISVVNAQDPNESDVDSIKVSSMLNGAISTGEWINRIQLYSKSNETLIDSEMGFLKKGVDPTFWTATFEWFNYVNDSGYEKLTFMGQGGMIWKVEPCVYNEETVGFITYEIDLEKLAESIINEDNDKTFHGKDFFIINNHGGILYYNDANHLYKNIVEGMECSNIILNTDKNSVTQTEMLGHNVLLTRVDSQFGNWIYAVADHSDVSAKVMDKITTISKMAYLSMFVICIICAFIITLITYLPVLKIVRMFTKENAGLETTDDEQGHSKKLFFNEIAYIIDSMMHLLRNNKNMEKELEERIALLNKTQVLALQVQTDPHFLYNSLDTIRWASIDEFGMDNDTCKMIENLSLLYRQYFKTDDTIVTVREEIEMLKMYMSIINIRFEGKLKFKIDVDKKLLDVPCLKMCLQPIVENAIKHGLRPLGYKGKIEVSLINKEDGDLEFCIKDNGVGFSISEISAKNRELLNWQNGIKDGVGLANVNSRLKLLYGDDYGVYIQQSSDSKKGSEVYIRFPKKQ